jgi:hypothetical protein
VLPRFNKYIFKKPPKGGFFIAILSGQNIQHEFENLNAQLIDIDFHQQLQRYLSCLLPNIKNCVFRTRSSSTFIL